MGKSSIFGLKCWKRKELEEVATPNCSHRIRKHSYLEQRTWFGRKIFKTSRALNGSPCCFILMNKGLKCVFTYEMTDCAIVVKRIFNFTIKLLNVNTSLVGAAGFWTRLNRKDGARAGNTEGNLKLLAKINRFSKVIIQVSHNDCVNQRLIKLILSFCVILLKQCGTFLRAPPQSDTFSHMFSTNCWLCTKNNFIAYWETLWGKPGYVRRDGIHPIEQRNITKNSTASSTAPE